MTPSRKFPGGGGRAVDGNCSWVWVSLEADKTVVKLHICDGYLTLRVHKKH